MKKYFIFFLLTLTYSTFIQAQQQINVPLDFNNWNKTTCGDWELNGDTLRVYGSSNRCGGAIETKAFYDLSNADVYIKWKVNGANQYMAVSSSVLGLSQGVALTTNHSYSSIVLDETKWCFTHLKINPSKSYLITISYDNYLDESGTLIDSSSHSIPENKWNIFVKKGKIFSSFGDNYGGVNCFLELAEVKLVNAVKIEEDSSNADTNYTFENGSLPQNFITHGFNWIISDSGYNSTKALYINSAPTENPVISLDISNARKVSFDVRYNSGYTWNPDRGAGFYIDSIGVISFDGSTEMCWHHFTWLLPDTSAHLIEWKIFPSSFPQNNAELWIDNISIYSNNITSVDEKNIKPTLFKLKQNYPNPFNLTTIIDYLIPQRSYVTIKVYNILGKKVGNLVNEEKQIGNYEAEFDGSNLSSGVYFYRMQAGDFMETKKLILLK